MKLNLGSGANTLDGFENLDKTDDWSFEKKLPYRARSVEAVTISHALMYVAIDAWPFVLGEIHRVLKNGGVLRVTEDDTENPASERFGGYLDAVTLTGPDMMEAALEEAGFQVKWQTAGASAFKDLSLCQAFHGDEPKVFFMEGIKA